MCEEQLKSKFKTGLWIVCQFYQTRNLCIEILINVIIWRVCFLNRVVVRGSRKIQTFSHVVELQISTPVPVGQQNVPRGYDAGHPTKCISSYRPAKEMAEDDPDIFPKFHAAAPTSLLLYFFTLFTSLFLSCVPLPPNMSKQHLGKHSQ